MAERITTIDDVWRDDFPGNALRTDPDNDRDAWTIVQTGAGQTVSVAASELSVVAGTTTNAETIIRSARSWTGPFRVLFGSEVFMSTRQANQEVELRLTSADGTEYASILFDGATATTQKLRGVNGGSGTAFDIQATLGSTAGSGVFELELSAVAVNLFYGGVDATAGRSTVLRKTRRIPNPDTPLFVEIRVRNLGLAPAGAMTFKLDSVVVESVDSTSVEVTGGRGGGLSGAAVAVALTGTPLVTAVATPSATGTGVSVAKVNNAAAGLSLTLVKASAARIYGWHLKNRGAAWAYVRIYSKATAPVAGESPAFIIPIPPGGQADRDGSVPITLGVGFGYAITSGPTDTDQTAVANANEVIGEIEWI